MKKSIFLLITLFGVMMSAQAVDYYYKGNQNGWSASNPMAVSIDGYYSYAEAKSHADNGNQNNHFKIAKTSGGWDYGATYLKPGFNNTNITDMGAWDGTSGNCCIYHDASYYVIVYHPNTKINTTNNPIICASTTLPYDGDCHLMGVEGDWDNGIKMELNSSNKNVFFLLDQPINGPIKFKLNNTWTDQVENYDKNGVTWEGGNIVLPAGNYDFYFKKDIMKVYIARNTVVTTTANPAEGGTLTGAGVYNNDDDVTLTAIPNDGYKFVNWTKGGEQVSADATYAFKAAGDVEYVANFELKTYTVKFLNYDGEVLQSTTVNHGETPVYSGKTPERPADAQYTYTFSGWDNAIAAATGDQTYKAQFNTTVNQYTITVNAENGTVTGAGTYDYGTNVTLTATANDGYEFVNWTKAGEEVSTEATYSLTVTENVDLVANFALSVTTIDVALPNMVKSQVPRIGRGYTSLDDAIGNSIQIYNESAEWAYGEFTVTGELVAYGVTVQGNGTWEIVDGVETLTATLQVEDDNTTIYNVVATVGAATTITLECWDATYTITDPEYNEVTFTGVADGKEFTILVSYFGGEYYSEGEWGETLILGTEVEFDDTDAEAYYLGGTYIDDANNTYEVAIFGAPAVVEPTPDYTRATTAGKFGTICLPFGSTNYTGMELFECVGQETGKVYIASVTTLEAGVPYIFLATGTELAVYSDGTTAATPGDHNGLHGTFTDDTEVAVGNYILLNNELCQAATTCWVNANRAYLVMGEVPAGAPQQMPGRRYIGMSTKGENAATGLDNITNGENTVIKTIENGQLIIIRNGEKFNAQGVRF